MCTVKLLREGRWIPDLRDSEQLVWVPARIQCTCGEELELVKVSNLCSCGQVYDTDGRPLMPRPRGI